MELLTGLAGLPVLEFNWAPILDAPRVNPEAPPGVGPFIEKILGWLVYASRWVALGAFVAAVCLAIARALGHAKAEGFKAVLWVILGIILLSSTFAILDVFL
ncbi:MAG: hypothetical protein FWG08_01815 [Propionibacteriaceae bacterium]|nr:hypothetical protein [Propionibacteriaceae bacterium]